MLIRGGVGREGEAKHLRKGNAVPSGGKKPLADYPKLIDLHTALQTFHKLERCGLGSMVIQSCDRDGCR